MIERRILISRTAGETRIAVVEDGRLAELEIDRQPSPGLTGNIYKGRVQRVLPGMQAAFVELGLERTAFLPGADYLAPGECSKGRDPDCAIEDRVRQGDDVLVQVTKEPVSGKGARLTSEISLAGRVLVYVPSGDGVGVAQRIDDADERERLAGLAEADRLAEGGWIIRTAAVGADAEMFEADAAALRASWEDIRTAMAGAAAPALLWRDQDAAIRAVRDLADQTLASVTVDDPTIADTLRGGALGAATKVAVVLDEEPEPLFERHGIEAGIRRALRPKIRLPSGGFVVVEATEAFTAIDVNSGRFVGKTTQRDTALATNLEAAAVIAEQLRLRNIGGVIVVDFIDLANPDDGEIVRSALQAALRQQRCVTEVSPPSRLGLIELTRRRRRQSLAQSILGPCATCGTAGMATSAATATYQLLRELRRRAALHASSSGAARAPAAPLQVAVSAAIASYLEEREPAGIDWALRETGLSVELEASSALREDQYRLA